MKKLLQKSIVVIGNTLQIDAHYFAKGSFFGLLQQMVGVTSGLIVFYIIGHFVPRDAFGEYSFALSILGMLTFISLPGMDTALIPSVSRGHDSSYPQAMKYKFLFSLIGTPILLVWAYVYYTRGSIVFPLLLVSALVFPFFNSFTSYPSFLVAKKQFSTHALFASISSLFYLAIFAIVAFTNPTSFNLLIAYFVALILPYIYFSWHCLRFVKKPSPLDTHLRSYGLFLTGVNILPWVAGSAGSVILGTLLGAESLAIFAICSKFLVSAEKNLIVLYKPITSKLAEQSQKEHTNMLKTHGLKFIGIGIFLSTAAYIITPYFIHFFFPQYPDAILYGQFMGLALLPLPIHWVMHDMIVYQKRKSLQLITSVIPDLVKLSLYFICIPLWGIWGLIGVALFDRFLQPFLLYFFLITTQKSSQT